MFDIKNSEDIELKGNKTSSESFAKIDGVKGLSAENNEAGVKEKLDNFKEEILELNPNFYGIGVRLRPLGRRIKNIGKIISLSIKS